MAILKIIVEKKLTLLPKKLIARLGGERLAKLDSFFGDRLKALLVDKGCREDFVEAVMAAGVESPNEVYGRARVLFAELSSDEFSKACKVVERTSNILKGSKEPVTAEPDPALFVEELEKAVFTHYEKSAASIRQEAEAGNFKRATSLYVEAFFDILNEFFDKVFVNAEDPKVRANRLALLKAVNRLYTAHIDDLAKIKDITHGRRS